MHCLSSLERVVDKMIQFGMEFDLGGNIRCDVEYGDETSVK